MSRIIEQGDESEPLIERARGVLDGINLDGSDSDLLGQARGAAQRIDEEKGTKPASLDTLIHGETPQQNDRYVDPR